MKAKTPSESEMTTARLMMPTDANVLGNVFGGAIMRYMDEIAAIVAWRHAGKNVVTASIDRMNFYAPVYVGDLLILKAAVNYVGTTSMEIGVRLEAVDPSTRKGTHTGSCYLTYVALDEKGKPTPIPPLNPVTSIEKKRFNEGLARRRLREATQAVMDSS
ncbi:MAG: acyl-CoA thioesterase [Nitrososphaerota archaeon]|nr:acyl-CoA thioesterase [Nitrososphaerota archaeon]MDG6916686.1 acyl-CoA thioesterase [Nitrososphaerota archaeon]MDG6917872.1 acyl-CoA thioesterase [Nitrososphaerota archaeon]MDG6946395.1 acyl-CoA thioesterase [Nitrososphaerota archaeon]MDG6947839.1 acyl-CoA thioesterase [Nitrososphaerota archaeon]